MFQNIYYITRPLIIQNTGGVNPLQSPGDPQCNFVVREDLNHLVIILTASTNVIPGLA